MILLKSQKRNNVKFYFYVFSWREQTGLTWLQTMRYSWDSESWPVPEEMLLAFLEPLKTKSMSNTIISEYSKVIGTGVCRYNWNNKNK